MNTKVTGVNGFQKILPPCALDGSSLSIGRVTVLRLLWRSEVYSSTCAYSFCMFNPFTSAANTWSYT